MRTAPAMTKRAASQDQPELWRRRLDQSATTSHVSDPKRQHGTFGFDRRKTRHLAATPN